MTKVLLPALLILAAFLAYRNHQLSGRPEQRAESSKAESTPSANHQPALSPTPSDPGPRINSIRSRIEHRKEQLTRLKSQRDQLREKIRAAESQDPNEREHMLSGMRSELASLQEQKVALKESRQDLNIDPVYTKIKDRLRTLEAQIHDLRPKGKPRKLRETSPNESPRMQDTLLLSELREELKRVQAEQKAFLEAHSHPSGEHISKSSINAKIKAQKKAIARLEGSHADRGGELRTLQIDLDRLDRAIELESSAVEQLSRELGEIESLR